MRAGRPGAASSGPAQQRFGCATYLHARSTAGWRTGRSAWIDVLAGATVVFNLFSVDLVVAGLHSYAGY